MKKNVINRYENSWQGWQLEDRTLGVNDCVKSIRAIRGLLDDKE